MLAPAGRADSGDFRVGGAAAGASVCVSVFFEKPNEVAWRRAREPARQTSVTTCAAFPFIKNLAASGPFRTSQRQSQKMMWLSGVGASALLRVPTTRTPANAVGHTLAGIELRAAGVVPYVSIPCEESYATETLFLMQDIVSGKRAGQLCDFGGRREESDEDAFATAARELCEETDGAFGSAEEVAQRLRHEWASARGARCIVHPGGKYATFFLRVPFRSAASFSAVDATSAEPESVRAVRWMRAGELFAREKEGTVLPRLAPQTPASSAAPDAPPSSFDRAVLETLSVERRKATAHVASEEGLRLPSTDGPKRGRRSARTRARSERPAAAAPKAPAWDQNELVLRGFAP